MITRAKDCVIITLYDNIVELERDGEINYSAEMYQLKLLGGIIE